jgi:hypothetical protein
MTQQSPPRWLEQALVFLLSPRDRETIPGDLLEEYRDEQAPRLGALGANLWYLRQSISFLSIRSTGGPPMKAALTWISLATAVTGMREPSDERSGVFTSGIVSTQQGQRIALYFTGRQHAGENLRDVLRHRAEGLAAPVQMADALSRNTSALPDGVAILLANCLAHGRRQFVEVAANFPEACRYVLEMLGSVYKYDAEARQQKLSPPERLRFHQQHSQPVMEQLQQWMELQFAQHLVEPNSGLGKAITYFLRHWKGLTAFLREAGAPLDNNLCTAVNGSAEVMPPPGLCRVLRLLAQPAWFLTVPDTA